MINEIKRMQHLAGLINESKLDEAVDTLNIQTSTSEEGNKQITLSVLGGGWTENQVTLSTEEAKVLIELAKEFTGNRNNPISKGVNTKDKNSTQSTISIQPDKLSLVIGRKEGSTYRGYDVPVEGEAGYLKAQQSIIYQIVDELNKNLNEDATSAPASPVNNKVQGSINLKLFQSLNIPDFNPATFSATINKVKVGTTLNMNDNKILANTMIALIKTSDDALLGRIFANLKQIEAKPK